MKILISEKFLAGFV